MAACFSVFVFYDSVDSVYSKWLYDMKTKHMESCVHS